MFSSDQDLLLNVGSEVCTSRTSGMKESESTQQIERNVPQCRCKKDPCFCHACKKAIVHATPRAAVSCLNTLSEDEHEPQADAAKIRPVRGGNDSNGTSVWYTVRARRVFLRIYTVRALRA
eukprot:6873412-Prymnesium_polylepis.4